MKSTMLIFSLIVASTPADNATPDGDASQRIGPCRPAPNARRAVSSLDTAFGPRVYHLTGRRRYPWGGLTCQGPSSRLPSRAQGDAGGQVGMERRQGLAPPLEGLRPGRAPA